MTSLNQDLVISVVTVVEAEGDAVPFVRNIAQSLCARYAYFEILVVDNASEAPANGSLYELVREIPQLRILRLSRKYDLEIALLAGLDGSLGDFAVLIDRRDPPELIPELLEQARSGYDVVIADAAQNPHRSLARRLAIKLSIKLTGRLLGYPTIPSGDYFRVLSRQVVNSVSKIRNKRRYIKYFNAMAGFRQIHVAYEQPGPAGEARARDIVFGTIDLILSNTAIPLRIGSLLGIIASFLSLAYLLYVLVVSLVLYHVAEGWITTSVTTTTLFLILFLILTVLSEYLARIYEEVKEQPLYFVELETSSSTTIPAHILNVV